MAAQVHAGIIEKIADDQFFQFRMVQAQAAPCQHRHLRDGWIQQRLAQHFAAGKSGGAEALVLKVINTSVSSICLAAYSFNSPTIVAALLAAKKRGVDIKVLADAKRNERGNSMSALNALVHTPCTTINTSSPMDIPCKWQLQLQQGCGYLE